VDRESSKTLALTVQQALADRSAGPATRARVELDGADKVAEILLSRADEARAEANSR
jgi:hypothetical protein